MARRAFDTRGAKEAEYTKAVAAQPSEPKLIVASGRVSIYVHTWLKREVAALQIDFRSTPDNGHQLGDVGFSPFYFCFFPTPDIRAGYREDRL